MKIEFTPAPGPGDRTGRPRCAETDVALFYPEQGQPTRPARRICARCEIRAECLQGALDRDEAHGIWGGLTTAERRRLRPARRRRPDRVTDVMAGVRRTAA